MKVKKDLFLWLIIAGLFISSIAFYPYLPERIPIHWNIQGEIDGYASKFWGAFFTPFMALGLYLLFIFLPILDPSKENYAKFAGAYEVIKWMMILFTAVLHGAILAASLGYFPDVTFIIKLAVGFMITVLGNYLGKMRHNYFIGIRTPWTLANEEVWNKTHRFAGPLWALSGLCFIIAAFFNHPAAFWLPMSFLMVVTFLSVGYSYWVFRQLQK